ncbi:hypothetical protein ACOSQ3_003265 [Xanthoceras sorbifolium]
MDEDCLAVRTKKCSVIPGMTDMRNDVHFSPFPGVIPSIRKLSYSTLEPVLPVPRVAFGHSPKEGRKKSLAGLESPTIKQPAISFISFFAHPPVDNRSLPSAGSGLYSTAKDTVVGEEEMVDRTREEFCFARSPLTSPVLIFSGGRGEQPIPQHRIVLSQPRPISARFLVCGRLHSISFVEGDLNPSIRIGEGITSMDRWVVDRMPIIDIERWLDVVARPITPLLLVSDRHLFFHRRPAGIEREGAEATRPIGRGAEGWRDSWQRIDGGSEKVVESGRARLQRLMGRAQKRLRRIGLRAGKKDGTANGFA